MIPKTDGHEKERSSPEIINWRNRYVRAIGQARAEGKKIVCIMRHIVVTSKF